MCVLFFNLIKIDIYNFNLIKVSEMNTTSINRNLRNFWPNIIIMKQFTDCLILSKSNINFFSKKITKLSIYNGYTDLTLVQP